MKKVLVVDDDSQERNGLCRFLERAGYDVRSAADGLEALQKVRGGRFDLLLLDIWMPNMNGLELLASLPRDSRPKTLVITGDETPEVLLRSFREHAYAFIPKPVHPDALLQLTKDALASPSGRDVIHVTSTAPNWVQLRFACDMPTATRVETMIEQLSTTLPGPIRQSVRVAFHELLMNAVEWGGKLRREAQGQVDYVRTRRFVMLRIADPGPGFDPSGNEHAAVTTQLDNPLLHGENREARGLRPGGFGIQLAKSLVDEVIYSEKHNEVAMVKYLD